MALGKAEMPNQAEANLSALIESTEDLIWSVDLEYRLITFNRALQRHIQSIFGVRPAVGMLPKDLVPPERVGFMPPLYERALAEGSFRKEFSLADGRILELVFNPIVVDRRTTGVSVFGKDITERKAAEESRSFLAEVVESCEEAIITHAPSGAILTWNHGAEDIYGYSADEAIGKSFSMIIAPERRARADLVIGQLLAGAPLLQDDGLALRKDGNKVHVTVTTWPIRNSAGEVTAICTIVRDVSVRHEAEKARALLASVVESSGDAILANDLSGSIISWNLGAERLFGYASEEILGKSLTILVFPGREGNLRKNLRAVQEGRSGSSFDGVLRHKDGRSIDIALSVSPIRDSEGKVVGGSAIARDISQRKRAEAALRESLDSLKEAQVIGGLGSYILDIGTGGWTSSDVLDEIFGIGKENEHTLAGWTALIHPDDRAMMAAYFAEDVVGKGQNFNKQYRIVRQTDHAVRWVHGMGRLEFDAQGQPRKMTGVIKDISESKLSEMQLRDSEERYRATFQMNLDSIDICNLEDGKFVDVNDAFLRITGFERDEIIGRTALEVGIWANPADRQKLLERMRLNSVCRNLEVQYRTRDGTLRWGLLSVLAIEMNGVPSILSFTRDITDDKEAAERLAKIREALRLSEQRYHTVFQTSLDAISINRIDDGSFIDCNKAFLDTLGYERDEVIGRTSQELGIWADERDRQAMRSMLQQNSSFRGLEVQFRKKNRELIWGEMSASLMEVDGVACILTLTRDITTAKAAEKTIRSLAFYDSLTGLPNRRQLLERLRQPPAAGGQRGRSMALLLVDLDHFKIFNDTLGHQTGDLLLKEVARRVAASVHEGDTVCRLGGDEFVVMIENFSEVAEEAAAQAKAVGEHVLAAIDRPYSIENREYLLTASIGITVFGSHQKSVDDVLQKADIAMDQAKAAGRNTLRFFSPALQTAVNARAAMEVELRQAIKTNQFQLYYQPQVERGRVTGAEALIRWNHPTRGLVMPDDFISVAEESRLILPMGNWVLETACEQIAAWADRTQTSSLSIAVNISALQFRQPEFVQQVLSALSRTGANPKNLRLELTESMLVEDIEEVIAKMTELRSHGLRFSLDDFGTGYSSLSYLKRLSLDRLKIDRSFVRDILADSTSRAIAQTIISLGKAMGLSVIAEGVETEEQRSLLTALGCHSFQGFLFSHPLPLDQFHAFLKGFAKSKNPR